MHLKMVALTRKPSGAFVARKAIPADIRDIHQKLYGSSRETKFYASSRTPIAEARQLFATWQLEIEGRFAALRRGASGEGRPISHREAHTLAGDWYAWFVAQYEDEPGKPDNWVEMLHHLADARSRYVTMDLTPEEAEEFMMDDPRTREHVRAAVSDWGRTSQFLAERGLNLSLEAIARFLDVVVPEYVAAARLLRRRAEGDYALDIRPERFPQRRGTKYAGMDCWQLFEAWVAERKPKPSTVDRRRGVFLDLRSHFGDRDITEITEQEAVAWKDTLLTPQRSGRTINDVWLVTAKGVFKWAVVNKKIERNPFEGLRVAHASAPRNRDDKAFTLDEACTILRASLKEQPRRLSKHYTAARRWVPWLQAYSGMRAQEATQLRSEDVVQQDGIWAIRIRPEAGTQKTNQARTIPLHEHLIEQGFPMFAQSVGQGPLFYDAQVQARQRASDPTNPQKSLAVKAREHLAKWVRDIGVDDRELAPNHAWRHLFKAIGDDCGIPEKISDAITGHAPANVARNYGKPRLEVMAKELRKFRRFIV